jgi:uncharacterized circularly permuted ATP-grasp superfamily protein/uncharacterized alpha-E superfamily protein
MGKWARHRLTGYETLGPQDRVALERIDPQDWLARQALMERALAELGAFYAPDGHRLPPPGTWRVDSLPFTLDVTDWQRLAAATIQRGRAFSLLLHDLYGERRLLGAGRLPAAIAFGDPAYAPEFAGLPTGNPHDLLLVAVDFVRTRGGEWFASGHHLSHPIGLACALQSRRLLAQFFPEYRRDSDIEPLASFPARLAEALRTAAPLANGGGTAYNVTGDGGAAGGLTVMLSRESDGRGAFEEAFLARQMGLPLAHPGDLVVRDFHLFYKTIGGLQPVTTVWRRVESESLDPVAWSGLDLPGVPGLIHCLRERTVRIVNVPGAGVLDNRSWLPWSEWIIRTTLGERCVVPSLPTRLLRDVDQAAFVAEQPDAWLIRPAPHRAAWWPDGQVDEWRADLVAHPALEWDTVPLFDNGGFVHRPWSLRLFAVLGDEPACLPGGWLRIASRVPLDDVRDNTWCAGKDVRVAAASGRQAPPVDRLERALDSDPAPVGSALAESMYWLGRYIERVDNTARMVAILAEEFLYAGERPGNWILWESMLAVFGEERAPTLDKFRTSPDRLAALLLLPSGLDESAGNAVGLAIRLSDRIRGAISPEFWQSISELRAYLEPWQGRKRLSGSQIKEISARLRGAVAELQGMADRSFVLDAAWRFLRIGHEMERAQFTAQILARVLPRAALRQQQHRIDDTELLHLLRITASFDAYHRQYRSRAFLDRTARLLWQNRHVPFSVLHCMEAVASHIATLPVAGEAHDCRFRDALARIMDRLQTIDLGAIFPARALELDWGSAAAAGSVELSAQRIRLTADPVRDAVEHLHDALEAAFFSHEASGPLTHLSSHAV